MRHSILLLTVLCFACDDDGGGDPVTADAAVVDAAGLDEGPVPGPDMRPTPDGGPSPDLAPGPDMAPEADMAPDAAVSPGDAALDGGAPADAGAADAEPDLAPPPEVECTNDGECLGFARCVDDVCVPPGESALSAVVVLNEILIDGAIDVDANDDGDISALDDEFVELLNIGPEPVDLAGATLVEADILGVPRHTFPAGFTLAPGEAVVLFGGGSPSEALEATPGARFFVINAQDPAFSNGLNLDDGGDTVRLLDAAGDEVFAFAYGDACAGDGCPPAVADQSLTRAPDGVGGFAPHAMAGAGPISPGRRSDGTGFGAD